MKLQWPGLQHRIILIRLDGADAFAMRRGGLVREATFRFEDMELFTGYCQSRSGSNFTVLVDLAEEDFRIETIPHVSGNARRQLLARKYDQAYRTTPYRTNVSLGREESNQRAPESKRRDERLLMMALTNHQALTPWLEIMHAQRLQVRGVHSLPVITGWISAYLGSTRATALFVTFNRAGLRQVYIDNGRTRFARLAAFPDEDAARAGERIFREISSTEQYLATLRWLPREGGPLRVVLVCPEEARANWRIACVNTDRLTFEFPDQSTLGQTIGLRVNSDKNDFFADSLWAAGALRTAPTINFAPAWVREYYALWRWRSAIIGLGGALSIVGIATGTVLLAQAKTIDLDADRLAANSTRSNVEYQQVAKSFPQMRITPEHLRGAVLALDPLAQRAVTPEPLMIQISQALLAAPGFTLTKLDWQIAPTPDPTPAGVLSTLRARVGAATSGTAAGTERYEVVVLTGAIDRERNASPRRKIVAARTAVEALQRIPGVVVTPQRLPLDVSPSGNLKGGDDDASATADADPIVVRLSRKVSQ